jgi:hypothetical protein
MGWNWAKRKAQEICCSLPPIGADWEEWVDNGYPEQCRTSPSSGPGREQHVESDGLAAGSVSAFVFAGIGGKSFGTISVCDLQ